MPDKKSKSKGKKAKNKCGADLAESCKGGAIYGLGFVGALVYYISTATGFWNGVWGVIKALAWPAFLIYELLRYLGA